MLLHEECEMKRHPWLAAAGCSNWRRHLERMPGGQCQGGAYLPALHPKAHVSNRNEAQNEPLKCEPNAPCGTPPPPNPHPGAGSPLPALLHPLVKSDLSRHAQMVQPPPAEQ